MSIYVGIVGANGSGKSTVCDYLETQHQFKAISLSNFVRDAAMAKGKTLDRDQLIATANELKMTYGAEYLAQCALQFVQNHCVDRIVFDSIRHPSEMKCLKVHQCVFIGIEVSQRVRFERIQERGSETDDVSFKQFQSQDVCELYGDSVGQNIQYCLELCDHYIVNDASVDGLYEQIDLFLKAHQVL